jgi:hypothetical protein
VSCLRHLLLPLLLDGRELGCVVGVGGDVGAGVGEDVGAGVGGKVVVGVVPVGVGVEEVVIVGVGEDRSTLTGLNVVWLGLRAIC